MTSKQLIAAASVAALMALGGCSAADVASRNISNDADMFQVKRRIVGINLITDKYLFVAEGKCSINADRVDSQLEITCKVGSDAYQKHFIGMPAGANVTYTVEQLGTSDVSDYSYSFIFRPEVIIPTVIR